MSWDYVPWVRYKKAKPFDLQRQLLCYNGLEPTFEANNTPFGVVNEADLSNGRLLSPTAIKRRWHVGVKGSPPNAVSIFALTQSSFRPPTGLAYDVSERINLTAKTERVGCKKSKIFEKLAFTLAPETALKLFAHSPKPPVPPQSESESKSDSDAEDVAPLEAQAESESQPESEAEDAVERTKPARTSSQARVIPAAQQGTTADPRAAELKDAHATIAELRKQLLAKTSECEAKTSECEALQQRVDRQPHAPRLAGLAEQKARDEQMQSLHAKMDAQIQMIASLLPSDSRRRGRQDDVSDEDEGDDEAPRKKAKAGRATNGPRENTGSKQCTHGHRGDEHHKGGVSPCTLPRVSDHFRVVYCDKHRREQDLLRKKKSAQKKALEELEAQRAQ